MGFGPYPDTILNYTEKAFYIALFLTGDYNTKSQKSRKLPGESKFYKVPHFKFSRHDA